MKEFSVTLRMWTAGGDVDVALSTDLDDQISTRLKSVVGAEFTKLQNDLRSKLDAQIAGKRKELEQLYSVQRTAIEKRLADYTAMVDQQTNTLNAKKKELTDKLEQEKKGKLDDAVKKIFKK